VVENIWAFEETVVWKRGTGAALINEGHFRSAGRIGDLGMAKILWKGGKVEGGDQ